LGEKELVDLADRVVLGFIRKARKDFGFSQMPQKHNPREMAATPPPPIRAIAGNAAEIVFEKESRQ
jgi:hypothetical protein